VSLATTAAAGSLWLLVGLIAYVTSAAVVLFYLPPADRVASERVADVAFAFTLPLVIVVAWINGARNRS